LARHNVLNYATMGRAMADKGGEITEAIEQLRSQLTAVQESSKDARLRFTVTEVEMEFLVEVIKEGGGPREFG